MPLYTLQAFPTSDPLSLPLRAGRGNPDNLCGLFIPPAESQRAPVPQRRDAPRFVPALQRGVKQPSAANSENN